MQREQVPPALRMKCELLQGMVGQCEDRSVNSLCKAGKGCAIDLKLSEQGEVEAGCE